MQICRYALAETLNLCEPGTEHHVSHIIVFWYSCGLVFLRGRHRGTTKVGLHIFVSSLPPHVTSCWLIHFGNMSLRTTG